jgi:hypothetical protein
MVVMVAKTLIDRKAIKCISCVYSVEKNEWKQRDFICRRAIGMIIYVSHIYQGKQENLERAKKITHDLQVADLENTYICPLLAFSHLQYGEIGYEPEMDLCLDLLSVADKLIVASDFLTSKGVQKEIDFANLVNMEVEYL